MLDVIAVTLNGQKRNRSIFEVSFVMNGAPALALVEFAPANLVKRRVVNARYNAKTKEEIELVMQVEKAYMPIMNCPLKKSQKEWLMDAIERSEVYQRNVSGESEA
jgi:hypothetical protein